MAERNLLLELANNPVGWSRTEPAQRLSNVDPSFSPLVDRATLSPQAAVGSMGKTYVTQAGAKAAEKKGEDKVAYGMGFVPNVFASIGGVGARLANHPALRNAQQLERQGAEAEDIARRTGWWRDKAGNWQFEIPDDGMKLKVREQALPSFSGNNSSVPPGFYTATPFGDSAKLWPNFPRYKKPKERHLSGTELGDVIEHPALFANYPELAQVRMSTDIPSGAAGSYTPGADIIAVGAGRPEALKQTLLHEIAHATQQREGFPVGGNPGQFLPADFKRQWEGVEEQLGLYRKQLKQEYGVDPQKLEKIMLGDPGKTSKEDFNMLSRFAAENPEALDHFMYYLKERSKLQGMNEVARSSYRALTGEQTAEAVARRANLSPKERANRLFFKDFDYPMDYHIMSPPENLP